MSEMPNAGTADPAASGSENAGTGANGQQGSEAAGGQPVDFQLAMTWKQKAEEANRLRDELESERQARIAAEQAARSTPATATPNEAEALLQQAIQEKVYRATVLKDPEAAFDLAVINQNNIIMQQMNADRAMAQVDQTRRSDVERVIQEARQRGEYITPKTAEMLLERQQLVSQRDAITRQQEELRQRQEAAGNGVVGTRPIGLPPVSGNDTMGQAAWSEAWDKAQSEAERDRLYAIYTRGGVRPDS